MGRTAVFRFHYLSTLIIKVFQPSMIPQGNSYVRTKAHPLSDTLMHKKLQMPSRFPFIMRLTSYCFNPAIVNSNYTEADKSQEVIKG